MKMAWIFTIVFPNNERKKSSRIQLISFTPEGDSFLNDKDEQ